ncbi:Rossman fold protein, TIGR00730 family [Niabella ginsenosidivorans]|uniref:Cytokinin riboside 5'-monophosphate phosphoribohydrolase n=1 Tax=Niabella ginsenosidivorans TaxID=1176587 RepID=A0A1A9I066_9BACT|nr:TIGR00730 family Rossman fold protein [Niabella ginsenosidivorans]ANH80121.1 Rossman fold protein, TIGR00730 family [Niabella ginsenosidivorans]
MPIKALAVFCGSKEGRDPLFTEHTRQLGVIMSRHNIQLVYGGGNVGQMGVIADAVLGGGGEATGVIPQLLVDRERSHKGLTQLEIVPDMHTRKKRMYELCDAAVILPGGYGTLDEFFEMITWNNLAIHDKMIFVLNTNGFYTHLLMHIQKMYEAGFLYEDPSLKIKVLNEPEDILCFSALVQ